MDDKPFASLLVVDMMQMLVHSVHWEDRADGGQTQVRRMSITPQGGVFAKCYPTSIPYSFAM
jgi:hypothetical protein